MRRVSLSSDRLVTWARFHSVDFNGVKVCHLSDSRGSGLVATWESENGAILMSVPQDLVLSSENVWTYARADKHLLQVLEVVGEYSRTARGAILIFLLLQLTNGATQDEIGVLNPFSEYIQYLPTNCSLPTSWSTAERSLLTGTSLEAALDAKLDSLDREFKFLRDKTSSIDWCKQYWWDSATGSLTIDDWKYVDAIYRSRALDLPGTGHAVVPCIDMANHASSDETTALYDTSNDGSAVLYLRHGKNISPGDEVTITYGDDKGACEMLFSYGFLEDSMTSAKELFLDLDIPDDDPLKLAKKAVSTLAPGFRLYLETQSNAIDWEGGFIWLLCVNEEDGLEFKLLQRNDGTRELQACWKNQDITDFTRFRDVLENESLWDVFHLRAITTLQTRIEQQLFRLEDSKNRVGNIWEIEDVNDDTYDSAIKLRELEESLLLHAYEDFEAKKAQLIESTVVQDYLASANGREEKIPEDAFSRSGP